MPPRRNERSLLALLALALALVWPRFAFSSPASVNLSAGADAAGGSTRAALLAAHPHLFPSCLALLDILERTADGRSQLQELLGRMQRLQYLQRTEQLYESDLYQLTLKPEERSWKPQLAVGLSLQWQQQQQQQHDHRPPHAQPAPQPHAQQQQQQPAAFPGNGSLVQGPLAAAAPTAAQAPAGAAAAAAVAPAASVFKGVSAGSHTGSRASATAAAAAVTAAAAAAAAASEAAKAAAAAAEAAVAQAAKEGADVTGGQARRELGEAHSGSAPVPTPADGSGDSNGRWRYVERILKASTHAAELQAELTTRVGAAKREREHLAPLVEAGLQKLKDLLAAAAANDGAILDGLQPFTAPNATAAAISLQPPTAAAAAAAAAVLADPNDLDLYGLLLAPCVTARLDPHNYVSYPPRPLVSVVLSYTGQRLPYIDEHVVQPLLACAAHGGGVATRDDPGPEGGASRAAGAESQHGSTAGAGARRRRRGLHEAFGSGGTSGGSNGRADEATSTSGSQKEEAQDAQGPPVEWAVELVVGFDDPREAPEWARTAAESSGRVVPVLRPAAASGSGSAGKAVPNSSSGGTARGGGDGDVEGDLEEGAAGDASDASAAAAAAPPLLAALNRLVAMAAGDVAVVLQDADALHVDCGWLMAVYDAFAAWPALGVLGSGRYVLDWHPASLSSGLYFTDEENGLPLQFVTAVTWEPPHSAAAPSTQPEQPAPFAGNLSSNREAAVPSSLGLPPGVLGSSNGLEAGDEHHDRGAAYGGPLAVRRAAWRQLGGLDEAGLGDSAACGSCAAVDLSTRMWLGGWQVAYMPMRGEHPEGTRHPPPGIPEPAPAAAALPWCARQQPSLRARLADVCAAALQERYGRSPYWQDQGAGQSGRAWFLGSELHVAVTEHVRQLNLRRLRRVAWGGVRHAECPFGAGGCAP